MAPSAFVELVETLLQRDGYRTQRPAGAGAERLVVATTASGDSMIVSAHHVEGPNAWNPDSSEKISTPQLHRTRRLADQHEAGLLVVVTNGGFSRPARRYAEEHGIDLLDRSSLQRWAEWQEPLVLVDDAEQDAA